MIDVGAIEQDHIAKGSLVVVMAIGLGDFLRLGSSGPFRRTIGALASLFPKLTYIIILAGKRIVGGRRRRAQERGESDSPAVFKQKRRSPCWNRRLDIVGNRRSGDLPQLLQITST